MLKLQAKQRLLAIALTDSLKVEFFEGLQDVCPYFKTWHLENRVELAKQGVTDKVKANALKYLGELGWAELPSQSTLPGSMVLARGPHKEWLLKLSWYFGGCSLTLMSEKVRCFSEYPGGAAVEHALVAAGHKVIESTEDHASFMTNDGSYLKIWKTGADKWHTDTVTKIIMDTLGPQAVDKTRPGARVVVADGCTFTITDDSKFVKVAVSYTDDHVLPVSRWR